MAITDILLVLIVLTFVVIIILSLRHLRYTVWRPFTSDVGEIIKVNPSLGYPFLYDPEAGRDWEVRGIRDYVDGSFDLDLRGAGGEQDTQHFDTQHRIGIKGGNIKSCVAPTGPLSFIILTKEIMDSDLGISNYSENWEAAIERITQLEHDVRMWEQRFLHLNSRYHDDLRKHSGEIEQAAISVTTKLIEKLAGGK